MKNLKRIFSAIISLTMLLSLFAAFSAQAAETEYTFYTQVGASFTPETEGVTWNNTDTIDTSVMGKQVIYGTKDGATVKGIVNVGDKKWVSYNNFEGQNLGNIERYGSDQWTYVGNTDYTTNKFASYVADPDNNQNKVLKIEKKTETGTNQNGITYTPATTMTDEAYQVEFDIKFEGITNNDDRFDVRLFDTNALDCGRFAIIKHVDGYQIGLMTTGGKLWMTGIETTSNDWNNVKICVNKGDTDTYSLYWNNELQTLTRPDVEGTKTEIEMYQQGVALKYIQVQFTAASTKNAVCYIDDVKISTASTTDYIYYDTFENNISKEFIQNDDAESIVFSKTVNFVDAQGNASGYSTLINANTAVDTSKIGSFSKSVSLPGFDEPIVISWKVYKEQLAWEETFENYTETDIGKAPNRLPWIAGTTGKTVEYENAIAEVKNTVLKYTSSVAEEDWLKMSDGKSINGKYSIEWSFMLPTLVPNTTFDFKILGDAGAVLIEPSVYVRGSGNGELYFTSYSGGTSTTVYAIKTGQLAANKWYTVKFTIDTATDSFTYDIGNGESAEKYGVRTTGNKAFYQFRLAQRNNSSQTSSTIYVDDVKMSKLLTIKEPVAKNFTVYKGDEAVLPETATVLLTDGETEYEAEVTWNGSIDTSTVGTKTITGAVTGADAQATLNVMVSAYPYEIVSANLKNGSTEVFGLIKGGELSSATINKIANDTKAGRVYAAVYDNSSKLIGANVVSIDTNAEWNKDSHKDIAITLNLPNSNDIDVDTCTLKLFVLSDSLVPFANVKAMSNTDTQAATTVWIAGDSLAETKNSTDTEKGWGEAFAELDANGITVVNRAIGGRSSKSFYDQGLLRGILNEAKEGDYLFVQFGSNDAKSYDATRYTTYTPGGTFEQYMTKYITEARSKGVIPVIFTPVVRAKYDANDTFIGDTYDNLADYAAAAKRVAATYHVPVIDLHALTANKFKTMTKDSVWAYYDVEDTSSGGNPDTTHLNSDGAELIADMIKTEMENIRLPLYKLFN